MKGSENKIALAGILLRSVPVIIFALWFLADVYDLPIFFAQFNIEKFLIGAMFISGIFAYKYPGKGALHEKGAHWQAKTKVQKTKVIIVSIALILITLMTVIFIWSI